MIMVFKHYIPHAVLLLGLFDLLLLVGAEPDVRWKAFSAEVAQLAVELGVGLVTGFGSYPAPVPHTRQGRIATTATSPELAARAGPAP